MSPHIVYLNVTQYINYISIFKNFRYLILFKLFTKALFEIKNECHLFPFKLFYYITTIFKIMHKAYIIHNCTVLVHSTKNLILISEGTFSRPQWDVNSRPLVYKTSALTPELWSQSAESDSQDPIWDDDQPWKLSFMTLPLKMPYAGM